MSEKLDCETILPVKPQRVYEAWLDSTAHSQFTGSPAEIDPRVGGNFKAWDGYIWGTTLELQPFVRIVQAWQTTDFPEDAPASRLEVTFEETEDGTRLTLLHTEIPDGQSEQYREGWEEFYFQPMLEYFSS